MSISSRVRWVQPPDNWVAHSGAAVQGVLHPLGGRHALPGKAVATRLAGLLGLGWLAVCFGFQTGHPAETAGFGRPFQLELGNLFLQTLDDGLLPDYDGNENIPVSSLQAVLNSHIRYMT